MTGSAPLAIAVVGCGWIMRSIYTPVLLSLGNEVRVCAVCDLDAEAARAMAGRFANATAFTEAGALLREAKPDAVLVLTSERATAGLAAEIMKAGIPVYVEKPPAAHSAELEELIAAEAQNNVFAYAAFNRRHVPLFQSLAYLGTRFLRVSGVLKRNKRPIPSFAHTAIHLIDSAQYYGRSRFRSWKTTFTRQASCSSWTIEGTLENGAECDLHLVPDGGAFAEFLILQEQNQAWELRFPSSDADVPEGELILRRTDGAPDEVTRAPKGIEPFEAMGFRHCLLDFLQHVRLGKPPLLHRPSSCRSTIRLMNEMEAQLLPAANAGRS